MTDRRMTTEELLPCPFCGQPPDLGTFASAFTIHCANEDCDIGAETSAVTEALAVEQWNKRAPSPTVETVNGEIAGWHEMHSLAYKHAVTVTGDQPTADEIAKRIADELTAARASAPAGADGWKPISTAPNDSGFRWYGLYVKHTTGAEWFEAHYLSHDDDGQMIESSGDHFTDWEFSDFEFWCAAPAPPILAEEGTKP